MSDWESARDRSRLAAVEAIVMHPNVEHGDACPAFVGERCSCWITKVRTALTYPGPVLLWERVPDGDPRGNVLELPMLPGDRIDLTSRDGILLAEIEIFGPNPETDF